MERVEGTKGPQRRVLVVEDDEEMRVAILATLADAGFACESAQGGLEAMGWAMASPFDLVVTDVRMPRLDGITLIERLRARSVFAGMRFVAVTGHDVFAEWAGRGAADAVLQSRSIRSGSSRSRTSSRTAPTARTRTRSSSAGTISTRGRPRSPSPARPTRSTSSSASSRARSDLYSLGATLYYMVAGRPPFLGASPLEILFKHIDAPVPPLDVVAPRTSLALARVIERLLKKDPGERFVTAQEVLRALPG